MSGLSLKRRRRQAPVSKLFQVKSLKELAAEAENWDHSSSFLLLWIISLNKPIINYDAAYSPSHCERPANEPKDPLYFLQRLWLRTEEEAVGADEGKGINSGKDKPAALEERIVKTRDTSWLQIV